MRPLTVVTPTVDADVLFVLAGARAAFTGRQVHQLSGRNSERGTRNALQRLSLQGIVNRTVVGGADLYELNRDHLAAKHVLGLAGMQAELWRRITSVVKEWPLTPVQVSVFGSAARGQMRLESDIDLFIVRPDTIDADDPHWADQVSGLSDRVTAWTGNDARVLEMRVTEVQEGLYNGEPVLADVQAQGLRLFGPANLNALTAPQEDADE